jgi:hypothetical protein
LGKESGLESDVNVLFVETKTYEKKNGISLWVSTLPVENVRKAD